MFVNTEIIVLIFTISIVTTFSLKPIIKLRVRLKTGCVLFFPEILFKIEGAL
jgi:hypothetical protein